MHTRNGQVLRVGHADRRRGLFDQLVNKFPAIYGTQQFITVFTKTHHCLYPKPAIPKLRRGTFQNIALSFTLCVLLFVTATELLGQTVIEFGVSLTVRHSIDLFQ